MNKQVKKTINLLSVVTLSFFMVFGSITEVAGQVGSKPEKISIIT